MGVGVDPGVGMGDEVVVAAAAVDGSSAVQALVAAIGVATATGAIEGRAREAEAELDAVLAVVATGDG